jgi:hypothetical protein
LGDFLDGFKEMSLDGLGPPIKRKVVSSNSILLRVFVPRRPELLSNGIVANSGRKAPLKITASLEDERNGSQRELWILLTYDHTK